MARAPGPARQLLLVYTGGTLGMRRERGVLVPGPGLSTVLRSLPMFHDEEYGRALGLPDDTLVLPPANPGPRIIYTVLQCQPLLDSSDMTITEWVQIAQTIERHYKQYHGFVVVHGTDTMAFAASVLSFALENLHKPVIFTGAQVPIHALWNDSRENLLGALLMAGQFVIPEVCLFIQNQLFRGNRVTKVDTQRFGAFCSPNLPPLATMGADVTVAQDLVRTASGKDSLVVHSSMECNVGLLRLYPGIPASLLLAQDLRGEMTLPVVDQHRSSLQGAVLGSSVAWLFGLSGGQEADALRDAVMPSLALAAAHAGDLEALQALVELGSDLCLEDSNGQTPLHVAARRGQEGVVTMLLHRGADVDARDQDGLSPLLLAVRGRHQGTIGLLRMAGACLTPQDLEDTGTELCRLASRADMKGLQAWWHAGADLEQPGYDGRSALRVAEAAGNLEVVALLRSLGAAGPVSPTQGSQG